jgi:hypothetical protein
MITVLLDAVLSCCPTSSPSSSSRKGCTPLYTLAVRSPAASHRGAFNHRQSLSGFQKRSQRDRLLELLTNHKEVFS